MNQSAALAAVVSVLVAAGVGGVGGFLIGLEQAKPDPYQGIAIEEAFRAGYILQACSGGDMDRNLTDYSEECQGWLEAFCLAHEGVDCGESVRGSGTQSQAGA